MTRVELEDLIIDIVRLRINLDKDDINSDSTFEELNIDALDYIEIEMTIELKLKFQLPHCMPSIYGNYFRDVKIIDIKNIKGLIDHVEFNLNNGK